MRRLLEVAAPPGAGLKALGNGSGNVYAANKALKARQDARVNVPVETWS